MAWVLSALGAFPVDRGAGDDDMIETAKAILARGDIVLIFPEGTRIRPGSLGQPKRGVGRLALETGAPVVPVAVIGTEAVRRGWRIRPHKVRIRAGRAAALPAGRGRLAGARRRGHRPDLAVRDAAVGVARRAAADPPRRRSSAPAPGARASRSRLARAGLEVDLGCRTAEQAAELAARARERSATCPASSCPTRSASCGPPSSSSAATTSSASPCRRARCPRCSPPTASGSRAAPGCSCSPRGSCRRSARCRRRSPPSAAARARSPCSAARRTPPRCSSTAPRSCSPRSTAASRASSPTRSRAAGLDVAITTDVTGVELAGCAKNAAVLAAARGLRRRAERRRRRGRQGVRRGRRARAAARRPARRRSPGSPAPATWSRPSSPTQLAQPPRRRAAGPGGAAARRSAARSARPPRRSTRSRCWPSVARDARLERRRSTSLAALVEGRIEPERWTAARDRAGAAQARRSPVRAA